MTRLFDALSTRTVLVADGVVCLLMGAGLIGLRHVLAAPTGLDAAFLAGAGALLLPVGLFILLVASGRAPLRFGLAVIVAGNIAWAAASILLPISGLIAPTELGLWLIVAQAVAVAAIAAIEARVLRPGGVLA
ncbi:MAG TPA: hypothetical protein VMP03_03005 [Methylomirabilota bacterium]|nr:hypothetical protein [Methylomirabilota bacterium]